MWCDMDDVVIRVEGLSKCYKIGMKRKKNETLLEAMAYSIVRPIKNLRELRYLSRKPNDDSSNGAHGLIWAIKDVSFTIKRGEIVGIIGNNGSGKSTILKILSRITEPTRGRAEIYGRVGTLLEVGTGFHPDLTGRENIYLNGTILGMKKREIDRKFDEIVDFSEVEKFLDTPIKRYSSGMQVRLAFAVAAHLEADILFIDEVLAVGDSRFVEKSLNKMESVKNEGRTILFVSHSMNSVMQMCDRCLWIEDGRLKKDGKTKKIINEYLK
jgi:lipopolysaccharide transport system ATP-binding protein